MPRLKPDISPLGMKSEALLAVVVADSVYRECDCELMLTSITDGKHMEGSLHYKGLAFDCRVSNVPQRYRAQLPQLLRSALGPQYDVVDEQTHIHVEFDPK